MNRKYWSLICFLLFALNVFSQTEELFLLGQNDTIISTRQHNSRLKSNSLVLPYTSILNLPFFDDFSRPTIFPYQKLWADQNVYINNTFCINPSSINVATFDALGADGLLHANAASSYFAADTLTSRPINLLDYVVGANSNNLFFKRSGTYINIGDSVYYKIKTLYNKLNSVVYNYKSSDTLYRQVGLSYTVLKDSIYTKTNKGFKYLDGSYLNKKTISQYTLNDSLFLSFFVQPGGIGDMPENTDSLILECYVPNDTNKILINEVAYSWIELYNPTDSVFDVAGFYLFNDILKNIATQIDTSNGLLKRSFFQIPNDGSIETRIPPMGLLVINASDITALKTFKSKVLMLVKDTISYTKIDSVYISDTSSLNIASYGREIDGDVFDSKNVLSKISKNALNGSWDEIWSASSNNYSSTTFTRISLPILNSFFHKGFRFRFINFASLSTDKSHARNEDQWNLDDVSIYSNHENGYLEPDLKFTSFDANIYENYSSVPYEHIKNISEELIQSYFTYNIQNTDTLMRYVDYSLKVNELGTKKNSFVKKSFGNENILGLVNIFDTLYFNSSISLYDIFLQNSDVNTYSDFDIKMYITDNESPIHEDYRWNDTVRIRQTFYNYYSYDDGSSEAGWGLRGAEYAQVAYKFTSIKKDTLNAVLMYFNKTLNTTDPTINICIWEDNKGKPGKILAQQNGEYLKYADAINKFSLYPIKKESILDTINNLVLDSNQTYYIGWIQPQDLLLNIGVDLNKTVKKKLLFKTGTDWQESLITNPLMLRPVFDKNQTVLSIKEKSKTSNLLVLYPNPTTGICTLKLDENIDISKCKIVVRNLLGKEVIQMFAERVIDFSNLPIGMYYITFTDASGISKSGKLIINR